MNIDKEKLKGLAGTVVVHAVIVVLLLFVVMRTPVQSEESGMSVLLGDADVSQGPSQQYQYTEVTPAPQPVQPQDVLENVAPKPVEEPVITQEDEPTVEMPTPSQIEAQKRAEQERQEAERRAQQERIEAERKAEQERQANELANQLVANALSNTNNATSGESEDPNATPTAQGNIEGETTGNPAASGSGVQGTFDLAGREAVGALPHPNIHFQEEGRVVVTIVVDPDGNVVSTSIHRRTNTTNAQLRAAAEEAARKAKFNKINGVDNASGTITYYFKVR